MSAAVPSIRPDTPLTLADVARDPSRLSDADHAQLAVLSMEVAALQSRLAARLAELGRGNGPNGHADRLLTVDEAASALSTTRDWLRRHSDALPFTVRLSPGQTRYSAAGIARYIVRRSGARK